MVEMALVLPILLIVLVGVFKLASAYNSYMTLTDAVRAGARQLAIERGQATPCVDAQNRVTSAAASLDQASLSVPTPTFSSGSTCSSMLSGANATVTASYTWSSVCSTTFLGVQFFPSSACTVNASATERVE